MALKFMLMFMFVILSTILILTNNPFMGSIILVLATLTMMFKISYFITQWVAYLLMLLFLGGMMILFLYVTSVMASLKFNFKTSVVTKILISLLPLSIFEPLSTFELSTAKYTEVSSMFNLDSFVYIVLVMFYLLLGLLIVVGICKKFEGSLKNKVND